MTLRPWLAVLLIASPASPLLAAEFRAGAAAVDVTPERFPVVVNCSFVEQTGKSARDKLHARALVLDDGTTRLAIVVVDSCMMPREFLDPTKELVREETGIPIDRQMISATHTHTAPAVMGCLGSDADPVYGEFLQRQIVRAVRLAVANLAPARAGWAVAKTEGLTNNRRWILRSDKVRPDPFGNPTVRANMHPGYQHPDFVGPSGPVDPFLSLLSIRSADGKPLAVLANFSMHYFGAAPVSADYFGRFCARLEREIGGKDNGGFVALLSQGTAGDLHWMDYGKTQRKIGIDEYANAVAEVALGVLKDVRYRNDVTLAMAEATFSLNRRVPDSTRLAWAKTIVSGLGTRKPTTQPEIYAREAVLLHESPRRELKLQAIRVGELGIAAIPNEVFALTGLKIKAVSPLRTTFVIELANGAEGYIPPPEQHALGGYTTWPARSAGLEVGAEPRIAEAVVGLLERVAGREREPAPDPAADEYARTVLAAKPVAYWRLGELAGDVAADLTEKHAGVYEPGVVFGLDGPAPDHFAGTAAINRAAQFAGGRMRARIPDLGDWWSVELWFWSAYSPDGRELTGALFSRGGGHDVALVRGRLSPDRPAVPPRTWSHLLFTKEGNVARVYLNGELHSEKGASVLPPLDTLHVGGRADRAGLFEGRIAEVAVYDRALTAADALNRVRARAQGAGE